MDDAKMDRFITKCTEKRVDFEHIRDQLIEARNHIISTHQLICDVISDDDNPLGAEFLDMYNKNPTMWMPFIQMLLDFEALADGCVDGCKDIEQTIYEKNCKRKRQEAPIDDIPSAKEIKK